MLEELTRGKTVIASYYALPKARIVTYVISKLKEKGVPLCVMGYERLRLEGVSSLQTEEIGGCGKDSFVIEVEAENPSDRADLITTVKPMKLKGFTTYIIEKIDFNLYIMKNIYTNEVQKIFFENNSVIELMETPLESSLLSLLIELGGTAELKDLVLIGTKRFDTSRERVRETVSLLAREGKVKISSGKVTLL